MNFEYDNFSKNNAIIKDEIRKTVVICLMMVASVIGYFIISYFFSKGNGLKFSSIDRNSLETIFNISNIAAIFMVVIVLAIRKTIYYSEKMIKEDFTLTQIMRKWRVIDIILVAVGETISVIGLLISLLGMPIGRTFHFFITSILVILIIMPFNWKVRDKLRILNSQRNMNVIF